METTDRLDYHEFLGALAESTTKYLATARFPATDQPVQWEHLLPWLTRDQECRFADFLEWRHHPGASDASALKTEERQFVVRATLGLISDEERIEQHTNAQLVTAKKETTRLVPLLRHQAETDRGRLAKKLGKELPLSSAPLFMSEVRSELARRENAIKVRERQLADFDQRERLRTLLESANESAGELKRSLKDVASRLALVEQSAAELAGTNQSGLVAALPPARDFCNVPLRVAHERGCPLATGRPVDISEQRSKRSAAQELAQQHQLIISLEAEASRIQASIRQAEAEVAQARQVYLSATATFEEERSRLQMERASLVQLEQLLEAVIQAEREAESKNETLAQIERDIQASYGLQEKIRDDQQLSLGRFSSRFDYALRAMIGEGVTGRVVSSGRRLSLTVEEHGERDSAAIATVKLLAFDLAAMMASIEGEGFFPRFLIHDGPREADMSLDVYGRLFLLAHELEKCFEGEPSFQYILTTTTRPPEMFANAPWLRLQLAGTPTEERLLRRDL